MMLAHLQTEQSCRMTKEVPAQPRKMPVVLTQPSKLDLRKHWPSSQTADR